MGGTKEDGIVLELVIVVVELMAVLVELVVRSQADTILHRT